MNGDECKRRCVDTTGCQAAQFCEWDSPGCSYRNPTNGRTSNCFIYKEQNDVENQLTPHVPNVNGYFVLYKYSPTHCPKGRFSGPNKIDIPGTGVGGTWANSLSDCQDRCAAQQFLASTPYCTAAQYSTGRDYGGSNCFIYNVLTPTQSTPDAIRDFRLYWYQGTAPAAPDSHSPGESSIFDLSADRRLEGKGEDETFISV